jgi:hypothetical protein
MRCAFWGLLPHYQPAACTCQSKPYPIYRRLLYLRSNSVLCTLYPLLCTLHFGPHLSSVDAFFALTPS